MSCCYNIFIMYYLNIKELNKCNPDAVISKNGDYLEKPKGGWYSFDEDSFIGIGYNGNESGKYSDKWKKSKKEGFIPSGGYG